MHRVTFRVGGEGPLVAAAAAHDAAADLWCDDDHDLLRVRGPAADDFVDAVSDGVAVRDVLPGDRERVAITECLADDYAAVDPLVAAHDCVLVPPLSYVDGRRLLRVLAPDGDRLAALYDDLRAEWTVDVVRKTTAVDAHGATPGDLDPLATLSDRQREALEVAVAGGYYERPRAIDAEDVAAAMGVGRRTAAEHLRKAERQVMTALVPSDIDRC